MTTPTFKSRFIYYWTTEQALALLELLADLREVLWSH